MHGQLGYNTQPHALLPPSFLGMAAWMTSQLNVALIRKLRRSLMCLASFFGMLSMGVCTTRYWQTSGRLVQELNVCTVHAHIETLTQTHTHTRIPTRFTHTHTQTSSPLKFLACIALYLHTACMFPLLHR